MPGPKISTVGPKRIKGKVLPLKNGPSIEGTGKQYMGQSSGFKSGQASGFGYAGSAMGGRSR